MICYLNNERNMIFTETKLFTAKIYFEISKKYYEDLKNLVIILKPLKKILIK